MILCCDMNMKIYLLIVFLLKLLCSILHTTMCGRQSRDQSPFQVDIKADLVPFGIVFDKFWPV